MANPKIVPVRRIRRGEQDTWQVGLVRLPMWVEGREGMAPFRPLGGLAVSRGTGLLAPSDVQPPEAATPRLAVEAVRALEAIRTELPGVVEVDDASVAEALREEFTDGRPVIRVCERLDDLAEARAAMCAAMSKGSELPPPTVAPGVGVEELRAFATAAVEFFAAAPWRELCDEDLIRVDSAVPDPAVKYAVVMGGGGEEFGMVCFDRPEVLELLADGEAEKAAIWSVSFFEPTVVDFDEHDLWLDHRLPTSPDGLIPVAACFGPKRRVRRASPRLLAFFEALLRAVARARVEELESGRWTASVTTAAGEQTLSLSLPEVLGEAPPSPPTPGPATSERALAGLSRLLDERQFSSEEEVQAFAESALANWSPDDEPPSDDPRRRAQDLAWEALDARGLRARTLAREALTLWPDCADAHVVLARTAGSAEECVAGYEAAEAAGRRALGPEAFAEDGGRFWGIVETRPYMRARLGLALSLRDVGRLDEAEEHFRELLRLNPDDNQGVREVLLPLLLALGRDDEARALAGAYPDDMLPTTTWGWALLEFRREGDGDCARAALAKAMECNPHVRRFLLSRDRIPDASAAHLTVGGIEEGAVCASGLIDAWKGTPGALDWLRAQTPPDAAGARGRARRRGAGD
ncbi:MAG: tetratricopeptide repeat protein [Acidobacteriota bacterium]